jgi:hypothetical protein
MESNAYWNLQEAVGGREGERESGRAGERALTFKKGKLNQFVN